MKEERIRSATPSDCEAITRIYTHYIRESVITFEEEEVTVADMGARLAAVATVGLPWLVADTDEGIVGYAYASLWKARVAYRYAVESTIYLDPGKTGRGIGRPLYEALLDALRARGFHTVIGGIALPNPASITLHERLGFVKVAHFAEVGFKFGTWIDVGYWQRAL